MPASPSTSNAISPTIALFNDFREQLDDNNDRRERLIKASRDVTNLSKKVIFLLHRIVLEDSTSDQSAREKEAASRGYEKLQEVQQIYASLKHELYGDRFWRYHRQVSSGLQEYIEALSFAHYLDHGTLITFHEVQKSLCDSDGALYFPLTVSDYLLGLSDLTGELMRFAISGISRRGGRAKATEVCAFMRACKADFERFTPYVRDLNKKQAVTSQSLEKIEDAAYTIFVRSSEYDIPPEMLDDIVSNAMSSYSTSTHSYEYSHPKGKSGRWRDDEAEGEREVDF